MIFRTDNDLDHLAYLCTVTGHRVGLTRRELWALATHRSVLGAGLVLGVIIALLSDHVLGIKAGLIERALLWPMQIALGWLMLIAIFAVAQALARVTNSSLLVVTVGAQLVAVLASVPLSRAIMKADPVAMSLPDLWAVLQHLLAALAFEAAVVGWLWPPLIDRMAEMHDSRTERPARLGRGRLLTLVRRILRAGRRRALR